MLLIIVLDFGLISHLLVVIFCFMLDDRASMLMMFSLTSLVTFVMLYTLMLAASLLLLRTVREQNCTYS